MEKLLIKDSSDQYYQSLPGQSWCTFTISAKGDFFIHSDWGYWAYNWRSFGDDFKKFLIGISDQYLFDKLATNSAAFDKKKINSRQREAITEHFKQFQITLRDELTEPDPQKTEIQ